MWLSYHIELWYIYSIKLEHLYSINSFIGLTWGNSPFFYTVGSLVQEPRPGVFLHVNFMRLFIAQRFNIILCFQGRFHVCYHGRSSRLQRGLSLYYLESWGSDSHLSAGHSPSPSQLLAIGQWFPLGAPVSSTSETDISSLSSP